MRPSGRAGVPGAPLRAERGEATWGDPAGTGVRGLPGETLRHGAGEGGLPGAAPRTGQGIWEDPVGRAGVPEGPTGKARVQ